MSTTRDIAQDLVDNKHWLWRIGMVDHDGELIDQDELRQDEWCEGARPEIDHPATRGWLMAMLREAGGLFATTVYTPGIGWRVYGYTDAPEGRYATEGEAIAHALLAAWRARR